MNSFHKELIAIRQNIHSMPPNHNQTDVLLNTRDMEVQAFEYYIITQTNLFHQNSQFLFDFLDFL